MASNFDKPPIYTQNRTWEDSEVTKLEKSKFSGPQGAKAKVVIYTGQYGIEFLLNKTYLQFFHAGTILRPWEQALVEWESCLGGSTRMA